MLDIPSLPKKAEMSSKCASRLGLPLPSPWEELSLGGDCPFCTGPGLKSQGAHLSPASKEEVNPDLRLEAEQEAKPSLDA